MIGDAIRGKGAKSLCEALKVNTTLKTLNLACENKTQTNKKGTEERMIGNEIGDEGAKVMSEMLRVNTTLTELNLEGEKERREKEEEKRVTV